MLSLIDENDLAEFLEEEPEPVEEEKPAVIIEEPQPEPVAEESQPEPEKAGMNMGAVLTILVLGAGVVGGYYYFKILKPKREEEEAESEDLEFYDGGAYTNEDVADEYLRTARRQLAQIRGWQHSQLSRFGGRACRLRQANGIYSYRDFAYSRISLRGQLGLSGQRYVRAYFKIRHARRLQVFRQQVS